MQDELEVLQVTAYVWPSEMKGSLYGSSGVVLGDLEELLVVIESHSASVRVFYPLLTYRELEQESRLDQWVNFYGPLVSLHKRGACSLSFEVSESVGESGSDAKSVPETVFDPLFLKLGAQLYPEAFEIQDQLELLASNLGRRPVFTPASVTFDEAELIQIVDALFNKSEQPQISDLREPLYRQKIELLESQLGLLQLEFARVNTELNSLRREALNTADLVFQTARLFRKD